MKTCTKCKETKEFSLFKPRKASRDGYDSHCRLCCKSYSNLHTEEHFLALQSTCTVTHKACTKCRVEQPLDSYSKASRTADGRSQVCNTCLKELNRQRYLARKALAKP